MTTALRLSDILARGVAIEWFEAVALVRDVSDRVRDSVGGRGVPELDQVQLAGDGTVSITGAAKSDEPVRRLGQLLQACLVQVDPPVQLRLIVAQATAPEPAYGSIRDFSEALAYFERPDRPVVLQALHVRAVSTPATTSVPEPTLDAIAPIQESTAARNPKNETRKRQSTRPSRAAVAAVAGVVLLVAVATAYSQFGSAAPGRTDVSALALKASDAVGTTLVKGISAVSETVGLGRFVPADASAPPPASSETEPAKPVRYPNPSTARASSPRLRLLDLATPPVVTGVPAGVARGELEVERSTPGEIAAPDVTVVVHATDPDVSRVYSPEDQMVAPPVGVRPQLPRVLPGDVDPSRLSEIELVILPDGTVGSVKLLGSRGGVLEGMLLSAAKAWKFQPAEKDGQPVAYRKTVWLVRD